ncbi:DNA translocase FtsK 4TM domain-containing protein [Albirhodobacter sp. R86504]|uniref:DNA translocase FtsK n=1 Tax=Albirhodobacter sp. R86504 TaxID=3093848 RepID=UPI00366B9D9A
MASYQARQRDPLLDQDTQAVLERRGKELLGTGFIVAGLMAALMLMSYSPEDPSWMAAGSGEVQNYLGRFGAMIASPLIGILGLGAWMLPVGLLIWGVRFITHRGEELWGARAVFLPMGIVVAAVHGALMEPSSDWNAAFGMGGRLGDMIAGSLLGIAPVGGSGGLQVLATIFIVPTALACLFVFGFTRDELRMIWAWIRYGAISCYAMVLGLIGQGAQMSVQVARTAQDRARERRARAAEQAAEMAAWEAQQAAWAQTQADYAPAPTNRAPRAQAAQAYSHDSYQQGPDFAQPDFREQTAYQAQWSDPHDGGYAPAADTFEQPQADRPSFMSRIKRAVVEPDAWESIEHELVEPNDAWANEEFAAPDQDRISARIADAVKTRAMQAAERRVEPVLTAPAAPQVDETYGYEEVYTAPPARPEPVMSAPASVLSAVAARLARGPKPVEKPVLRAEPPVRAQPRFMPGVAARASAPQDAFAAQSAPVTAAASTASVAPKMRAAAPAVNEIAAMPPRIDWEEDAVNWEPEVTAAQALAAADRYQAYDAATETAFVAEDFDDRLATDYADDYDAAAYDDPYLPDRSAETHSSLHAQDSFDNASPYVEDEDDIDAQIAAARPALNRVVIPTAEPKRAVVQHAIKKPVAPSKQAMSEAQPALRFEPARHAAYEMPPLGLLMNPASISRHQLSDEALEENARMLETVLDDYGVKGEIVSVRPGPVVTMYELEPAPGLKASRVIGLADDIARSMSALSARVSTVPGRSVIGIELPNEHREKVVLREILSARDFGDSAMKLPLALGKDISGEPIVANLAKMPHLLIAGTTGSGKSVAINTMILSLLYKLSPEECRMIMIDPKMLELSVYDGIPHLLSPVVTDPKKAVVALKWVVGEMEERYRKMSKMGVRNIEGYNGRVKEAMAKGELFKRTVQTGFDEETGEPIFETDEFQPTPIPYIVVIVDEMADLMMVAGKEIEACIQRLAQMARASGIHLIMATQRPSVDVITGTIKANFPTRISFQVTSKIDSRTILGEMGAEQLLGMGDMLYMGSGSRVTRIHGPFVSDEEVEEIVTHLKSFGPPEYMSGVVEGPEGEAATDIDAVLGLNTSGDDAENALYDTAVAIVAKDRKCSTSYIQRKLGIGYNKAARLVEQMEDQGIVSAANHVGKREILVAER